MQDAYPAAHAPTPLLDSQSAVRNPQTQPPHIPHPVPQFGKIFPMSRSQIDSLMQPSALLTTDQAREDVARYDAAVESVKDHPFAIALLGTCRMRLSVNDPITRGLVTLVIGFGPNH